MLEAASDGAGPQVGERVVFLSLGARGWAQRRAVPHAFTAAAPSNAAWEHLATLPVPATTALRALRKLGSTLGRRVLIVGATSAVGRIAVQLAGRSGAHVAAVARDESRHAELQRLGAHETHAALSSVASRVHGAIDRVGGQDLVDTYALLEPGATVIALGHSAGADERFPYDAFVAGPTTSDRSITSFFLGSEPGLADEMAYLAADRRLQVGVIDTRAWTELATWIEHGAHRPSGRVVLRVIHAQSSD
ncbi:zinc-binding dehydrogenase [Isoptericola halotolerans]|uniref:zinc-binding dehydrogenase n=1 Tax=Isoptericola halotolerans TaxID=300560 RepID=UPI00388E7CDB